MIELCHVLYFLGLSERYYNLQSFLITLYLTAEVNQFTKKGAPWSNFKLSEKTKEAVRKHLDSKMSKYKAGDVNKV